MVYMYLGQHNMIAAFRYHQSHKGNKVERLNLFVCLFLLLKFILKKSSQSLWSVGIPQGNFFLQCREGGGIYSSRYSSLARHFTEFPDHTSLDFLVYHYSKLIYSAPYTQDVQLGCRLHSLQMFVPTGSTKFSSNYKHNSITTYKTICACEHAFSGYVVESNGQSYDIPLCLSRVLSYI